MSSTLAVGRPRSVDVDQRLLQAALEVLADVGPDTFSIEAVSARSGVSKAAIYRRYSGRSEVLAAALESISSECAAPDSGLPVRTALIVVLDRIRSVDGESLHGRIMRRMVGIGLRHPDLHRSFHERFVAVRRARVSDILRRAQLQGEVRPEVDVDMATALLVGAVVMSVLNRRADYDPAPPGTVEQFVDMVLAGIAV